MRAVIFLLYLVSFSAQAASNCPGFLAPINESTIVDVTKVVSSKPGFREEQGFLTPESYLAWLQGSSVIAFYSGRDAFGEFSNFARFPIVIDGKIYQTSEHYYQSQKFKGSKEHEESLRIGGSPKEIAKMGRDKTRPLRADWDQVKDDVMRKAVEAKFFQHASLARLLLSTGDKILIEHTENDRYWADFGDGSGPNMLGKVLMEVREKLKHAGGPLNPLRGELRKRQFGIWPRIFRDPHSSPQMGFLRYFEVNDAMRITELIMADSRVPYAGDEYAGEIAPYSRLAIENFARRAGIDETMILRLPVFLDLNDAPINQNDPVAFLAWMKDRMKALEFPRTSFYNLRRVLDEFVLVSASHDLTPEHMREIVKMVSQAVQMVVPNSLYEMRDESAYYVGLEVSAYVDQQLWGRNGLKRNKSGP